MRSTFQLKKFLFICSLMLFVLSASSVKDTYGQTVTGTVTTAEAGEPLPGVNVIVKGTTSGTITDTDGKFSIQVPDLNATLRFSFIGYENKEVPLNGQNTLDVVLKIETEGIDDVVVIGYGVAKSTDISGAISVVDSKEISQTPSATMAQALQGKASGVLVTQNGSPGGGVNIRVRGVGSINSDAQPLYVIDGVVGADINSIAPEDIKSISILKDAASAAIYGANGANGVVLVTTKRGKSGKTSVTFSTNHSIKEMTQKVDLMNANEYAQFYTEMDELNNVNPSLAFSDGFRKLYYGEGWQEGTDWQDAILQDASSHNYYLRVSGGGENSNYSISANYYEEAGLLVDNNMNRINLRANSDFEIGNFLTIGESVSLTRRVYENVDNRAWHWVRESSPLSKIYNENNKEGYEGHQINYTYLRDTAPENPVLVVPQDIYSENPDDYPQTDEILNVLNTAGNDKLNPLGSIEIPDDFSYQTDIVASVYAELKPFDWLSLKTTPSATAHFGRDNTWTPSYDMGVRSVNGAVLNVGFNESYALSLENQATIIKEFGKHDFNLTGVHHVRYGFGDWTSTTGRDFQYESFPVLNQAAEHNTSGGTDDWAEVSYLGRLMYNYDGKYLFTSSIRKDGTSNFGPKNKWGTFPSFSAGWKFNEDLFPTFEPIDMAKLRIGWGKTGNSKIGADRYTSFIDPFFLFNVVLGADQDVVLALNELNSVGNPYVKWEAAATSNIGIDINALNGKIQLSSEYYIKKQNDLLVEVPISTVHAKDLEEARPFYNIGKIENRGFEFDLRFSKKEGKFNYFITANLTTIKNKVNYVYEDVLEGSNITTIGHTIGSLYGFIAERIIQEDDFDEEGNYLYAPHGSFEPQPGDIKFKDLNNDGVVDDNDRAIIGKSIPDFTYTLNLEFNYLGFDAIIFLYGMQNYQVYNYKRSQLEAFSNQDLSHNKSSEYANNYWTPENPSTEFIRPDLNNENDNSRASSWWVEDASFIRVKDLQIGYTLPQKIVNRVGGFKNLRIYGSILNLFTYTKYSGLDPEAPINSSSPTTIGTDANAYPIPRSFSLGLQIDF